MKSQPTAAPASSMSIRTGLVSRFPAHERSSAIMAWLLAMAELVETPGMMALTPPEYPAK